MGSRNWCSAGSTYRPVHIQSKLTQNRNYIHLTPTRKKNFPVIIQFLFNVNWVQNTIDGTRALSVELSSHLMQQVLTLSTVALVVHRGLSPRSPVWRGCLFPQVQCSLTFGLEFTGNVDYPLVDVTSFDVLKIAMADIWGVHHRFQVTEWLLYWCRRMSTGTLSSAMMGALSHLPAAASFVVDSDRIGMSTHVSIHRAPFKFPKVLLWHYFG